MFDDQGSPVSNERGELVCRNSFPNQPIGFWHDNGERYHQAYWSKYQNCWHHGDDVLLTDQGGVRFFGRSDATLNPGGVRIGTAEIYQQVNQIEHIIDSIAVGFNDNGNEQVILFVQLLEGKVLCDEAKDYIKQLLKTKCSPRHVPHQIYAITEVPRTKSGKLVELAVKQVLHGEKVNNLGAIANPEVLDQVKEIADQDFQR